MKFLLDVCVSSRALEAYLNSLGHDVLSAYSIDPQASDEHLLTFAHSEGRTLVTKDNDFGELVFVRRLPHGPIVRLVEMTVDRHIQGMADVLTRHSHELHGAVIITVTRARIRIRR